MHRTRKNSGSAAVYVGIVVMTAVTFAVSGHFDLMERFIEFSHSHERWELDEAAVLALNMILALLAILFVRTRDMRRALRERDAAEASIRRMARHDALTGLLNRRAFLEHMRQVATRDGRRMTPPILMMLDLDRFKAVNDLHGHACGDTVLVDVARRLTGLLRYDDVLARLGGDEFGIALAPGSNVERAERLAHKICADISRPFQFKDISVTIGTCVGLATLSAKTSVSDGLSYADHALYAAKNKGRGQFAWYDAGLDAAAKERLQIEADLRQAIGRGEVVAHYQPIFDIKTQALRGFEVLARWRTKERGEIPPSVFIGIAEDTGLIAPLGWNILEQACRTAIHWPAHLKMSVNFSSLQFQDPQLVDRVAAILQKTGFDPQRLDIEITESAFMKDIALAQRSIEELHRLGISLSLDDFGTGYSSLSYLRQLPFDRIKIDRSFVTGIQENTENQKLVTGILSLAQGLSLDVTAEGIETADELAFLQAAHCQLGQGYVFARAVSADEVNWLLETKWSPNSVADDPSDQTGTKDARRVG